MLLRECLLWRRYTPAPALPAQQPLLPWQAEQSSSLAHPQGALTKADFVAAIVTSKHNEGIAKAGRLWRQVSMHACIDLCGPAWAGVHQ